MKLISTADVANGRVAKSSPTKSRTKGMKQESFENAGDDMFKDPTLFAGEGMGAEMHSFGDELDLENENFFG